MRACMKYSTSNSRKKQSIMMKGLNAIIFTSCHVYFHEKKIIFTCLIISHFFSSLLFFMASSCFTSLSGGFLGYHLCMRPPKVHRQQLENVAQKFYEAIVKIGFRSFGLQEKNTFNFSRRRRKAYALFDTTSQVSS